MENWKGKRKKRRTTCGRKSGRGGRRDSPKKWSMREEGRGKEKDREKDRERERERERANREKER